MTPPQTLTTPPNQPETIRLHPITTQRTPHRMQLNQMVPLRIIKLSPFQRSRMGLSQTTPLRGRPQIYLLPMRLLLSQQRTKLNRRIPNKYRIRLILLLGQMEAKFRLKMKVYQMFRAILRLCQRQSSLPRTPMNRRQ
jgi:hypothetical protein